MPLMNDRLRKLELVELTASAPPELLAQARELLLEYGRFVISHPAAARFCFGTLEKEAERLPLGYHEQGGGALVGLLDESPMGFVAWRLAPEPFADHAWELKRLWVRSQGRGTGLGRALTQAVLNRAASAGRKAVYLDTVPSAMTSALKLYLEMGFKPCPAYGNNPVEELEFLRRDL
jgi:GNAT superfamily N-acetyltransferase